MTGKQALIGLFDMFFVSVASEQVNTVEEVARNVPVHPGFWQKVARLLRKMH